MRWRSVGFGAIPGSDGACCPVRTRVITPGWFLLPRAGARIRLVDPPRGAPRQNLQPDRFGRLGGVVLDHVDVVAVATVSRGA